MAIKSKTADKPSRAEILEIVRHYQHNVHDCAVEWFSPCVWLVAELTQEVKRIEDALTCCCQNTDIETGRVLTDEAIEARRKAARREFAKDGLDFDTDPDVMADPGVYLNVSFADGTFEDAPFQYWMDKLMVVGDIRDFRNMYRFWTEADLAYINGDIDVNPRT